MSEDLAAVFGEIYAKHVWGAPPDPNDRFYSGSGAHDESIVGPYVAAVRTFLRFFEMFQGRKANVVDLGCGDFFIGSRLRSACAKYVACDVVPELIAYNADKFAGLDVAFRALDLTRDALPDGDVIHVRQVLQHLSNADITRFLAAVPASVGYVMVTEHLPSGQFPANLDKPSGHGIRLLSDSGVVLTSPPFALAPLDWVVLSDAPELNGLIRTNLYRLR